MLQMRFYVDKKVVLGFLVSVGLVTWLAAQTYIYNQKLKETTSWLMHTNRVLYHTSQLRSVLAAMEAAERGYRLGHEPNFRKQYEVLAAQIYQQLHELKERTKDNIHQQHRLQTIEGLALREQEAFLNGDRQDNYAPGDEALMQRMYEEINAMEQDEKKLRDERSAQSSYRAQQFNNTFFGLLVATGIILVLVLFLVNRHARARYHAEQAVRSAAAHIQDIYDHAPCGYHSLDERGVIQEMNQTWLNWLQYKREDIVGKRNFADLLTPESLERFKEQYPLFKERGYVNDLEFDLVRRDGTILSVILSSSAVRVHGKFSTRSTAIDYTEKRRANEQILLLNKELESFAYSVSHDLRAPLRSVNGYTKILQEDYADKLDAEGIRVLNIIINSAARMNHLIDDLLNFSRLGRKALDIAPLDMTALVRAACQEVAEPERAQRTIHCEVHTLLNCPGDPSLIRQVWINLMSNAVKYTRGKAVAEIEITSKMAGHEVQYCVRDNGIGFDMAYQHKLFQVFQRLHHAQDFEGTGVGLAIVHRIVTRHGGSVWAESEAGQGAAFYFSLPTYQNPIS